MQALQELARFFREYRDFIRNLQISRQSAFRTGAAEYKLQGNRFSSLFISLENRESTERKDEGDRVQCVT